MLSAQLDDQDDIYIYIYLVMCSAGFYKHADLKYIQRKQFDNDTILQRLFRLYHNLYSSPFP